MGAGAQARAPDPPDHLALAYPIALLHVELAEVAVEGASPRSIVFHFNRQPVAACEATAHHPPPEGRYHGCAVGRGQILAGMHQPTAQNWVQSPAEIAAGCGGSDQRKQQLPIAVAADRCGPGGHPEHLAQLKLAPWPSQQRRYGHREGWQRPAIIAQASDAFCC